MSEVPERGKPETMVIIRALVAGFHELISRAFFTNFFHELRTWVAGRREGIE